MNQYDVSVVVPIYNCEQYLEECIKSIRKQDDYDLKKIQVILINDGSTDDSLDICNRLKQEINEFKIDVISGENQGVSAARNKGLKAAKGKYIMFLDADDYISNNTIVNLVDFFNEHYDEIDLITYPLYYFNNQSKRKNKLDRFENFYNGTDVYDLKRDYYLIQPNMSIMVKNTFENNILFDTKIKFHEDEKYNVDILMNKMKIGYVNEAKYLYRRYEEGVTQAQSNPYFCFEDFMYVYEYYISKYTDKNGNLPKYIQATILNDFRWKLAQDKLFPYFYEKEKFDEAMLRIKKVLNYIENDTIIQDKYVDRYHKLYLLKLKGVNFELYTNHNNTFSINSEKELIDVVSIIEIVINRFKVKNKKIYILGYLKSPIFMFKDVELYLKYKNCDKEIKEKAIKLGDSTGSLYKTNVKVANFKMFECEINLTEIKQFEFVVKIDNLKMNVRYIFGKYAALNNATKTYKIYDIPYRVQFKAKQFLITEPKKKTRIKDFFRFYKKFYKINPKINFFRIFSKTNKKIWLYNDRVGVFDNAYLQFKHDIKIKDGIKRYYILDGNIKKNKTRFSYNERKHVVKFGSLKHKLLFLKSDKIITSFSNIQEFCPLYKKMQYYKDICKFDVIYLQHGVLHATCIKIYSKEYTPLDKIVISSHFEKNSFVHKYNYSEKDLITCGMPRLEDNLEKEIPQNKIILAPSWRNYLVGKMINRQRKIDKNKFTKSKYFTEMVDFLQNPKLIKCLKENDIVIDFKLHPIFEPYKECFEFLENNYITVSIGETNLSQYKAFITDFSSFQFDFVKLKRPITYFVPDMKEFKAGLHLYRELDLKYEDAFGKLCLTGDELVSEIIKLINNNFEPEPIYKERMENFFFKIDNCKDKLYEYLKEE